MRGQRARKDPGDPSGGVRLGLVGCGRLSERGYLPAAAAARGVELVAVADADPSRRGLAAPGVPAFPSAEELIARVEVDALVLATPAAAHVADARLAASAGLCTLVEKPPAPDLEAAAELTALEPPCWVGFNRRFDPGLARLREVAAASSSVELVLGVQYRRSAWGSYVVADDVLDDLGSHLVDLARWLAGRDVVSVRTSSLDVRRAEVELDLGGVHARIACANDSGYREWYIVQDADGRRLAVHGHGPLRSGARRLRRPGSPNSLVASLTLELEALARAIRGEDPPHPASAFDGLAAMAALDAARRSFASGARWASPPVAVEGR